MSPATWFIICVIGVGLAIIVDGIREVYIAHRNAQDEA